jgi:hypothetical protein
MISQDAVLRILVATPARETVEFICGAIAPKQPCAPRSPIRRKVIVALSRLMEKKYVDSQRTANVGGGLLALYLATDAGRRFIASGGNLNDKVGNKAESGHRRSPEPGSIRQRLWAALRLRHKATLGDLVEIIHRKGDPRPDLLHQNAQQYLKALSRAGIVVAMQNRVANPGSRGFVKWSLVNDLGPLAPSAGRASAFDPNARKRIPYQDQQP